MRAEAHHPYRDHRPIAAACRQAPGVWAEVGAYVTPTSAKSMASFIRTGRLRAYRPARSFEAEVRDGTLWTRYVGLAGEAEAGDLERVRSLAVALEQDNARLLAVIGHLLSNALGTTSTSAWDSDIDAFAGRVGLSEQDGRTVITVTEGDLL